MVRFWFSKFKVIYNKEAGNTQKKQMHNVFIFFFENFSGFRSISFNILNPVIFCNIFNCHDVYITA
jgi:hypothetical protein